MKKATYLDTTCTPTDEEYKEFCELNEVEPSIGSKHYYDWMSDEQYMRWDDFRTNLKFSEIADKMCVILGTLGLWHGRVDIQPVFESVEDAIHRCLCSADDAIVSSDRSGIHVTSMHHDGSNHFTIKLLSKTGYNRWIDLDNGVTDKWNVNDRHNYNNKIADYLY